MNQVFLSYINNNNNNNDNNNNNNNNRYTIIYGLKCSSVILIIYVQLYDLKFAHGYLVYKKIKSYPLDGEVPGFRETGGRGRKQTRRDWDSMGFTPF